MSLINPQKRLFYMCRAENDAGGSFSIEEIASFVEINKHPLLTVLNSKNANMVYGSPMKLHVCTFGNTSLTFLPPCTSGYIMLLLSRN